MLTLIHGTPDADAGVHLAPEPSATPLAVVKHELTPTHWVLQAHRRDGTPGLTIHLTDARDHARAERLAAWVQDFYELEGRYGR